MKAQIVLSHYHVRPLLLARKAREERVATSPDLGLTQIPVSVRPEGARFPTGDILTWEAADEIAATENSCFLLQGSEIEKIVFYSEETGRVYSLMPTEGAPTMLISGIPMHRIKGTDPHKDTLEKIKTIQPLTGSVLDTATGLGYTAIEAGKTARSVVTIELDPAALEVARLNPWSRGLFENPRIEQHIGDSYDVIEEMRDRIFDSIIHDPPAFSLAGHLYSGGFYSELYRVLRNGGKLFHYIGNPESKSGKSVTAGVIERLVEAGFQRVRRRPSAFGVVASK